MKKTFLLMIFCTVSISSIFADDSIYKWTDENNIDHYTNQKQMIDNKKDNEVEEFKFPDKERIENDETEHNYYESEKYRQKIKQKEKEQQEIKTIWQEKARNIDNKIAFAKQQIEITRQRMEYLDNEIEYMLINGYSADYMIYELRTLENQIPELEDRLAELEQEKEKLKREARKKGIPPGYLRP